MVRVLCLEEDDSNKPELNDARSDSSDANEVEAVVARPDPNFHHRFSAALSCYPIVSQLARSLDLTSLNDLARTCRRFRVNLLPYRRQLVAQALRCENERDGPARQLSKALNASMHAWTNYGHHGAKIPRITSGRVSACARDLVGECNRCSHIVCRNCVMKTPSPQTLRSRHRRLCRTCIKADLPTVSRCSVLAEKEYFTTMRSPCSCMEGIWICSACGQSARSDDTTYMRGWSWRTRYSTCGGFGAGLGEGVEGVECGRGLNCLAAVVVEKEVECDAGELALIEAEVQQARLQGRAWAGNSYMTHEMVGIGGQVKVKVKKMVVVGATVRECEDERSSGDYLHLERAGIDRSWCSWCDRVIPSKSDMLAK